MVTTVAPATPVVAASSAPTITMAIASPPFSLPHSLPMVSSNSSARPERSSTTPMKINSGTASRVKLVMIPQILSGSRAKKSRPRKIPPKIRATAPSVNATG